MTVLLGSGASSGGTGFIFFRWCPGILFMVIGILFIAFWMFMLAGEASYGMNGKKKSLENGHFLC